MLNAISWSQFLIALLVLTVFYYGVVIMVYYRKDLAKYLSRKKEPMPGLVPVQSGTPDSDNHAPEQLDDFELSANVTKQLSQVIDKVAADNVDPSDMIKVIGNHLMLNSRFKGTPYQTMIDNTINRKLKEHGYAFSEQDAQQIWDI